MAAVGRWVPGGGVAAAGNRLVVWTDQGRSRGRQQRGCRSEAGVNWGGAADRGTKEGCTRPRPVPGPDCRAAGRLQACLPARVATSVSNLQTRKLRRLLTSGLDAGRAVAHDHALRQLALGSVDQGVAVLLGKGGGRAVAVAAVVAAVLGRAVAVAVLVVTAAVAVGAGAVLLGVDPAWRRGRGGEKGGAASDPIRDPDAPGTTAPRKEAPPYRREHTP